MIDVAQIQVLSGSGGNGAVSYRREKFVPMGGPDGGDGGRGGDVLIQADEGLTTLAHFRRRHIYKAESGVSGRGQKRHGANGKNLLLKVPVGTVIGAGDAVWDLDEQGAMVVIARGGDGGRGNARFANSIRQAPGFAEKGLPGEELALHLELKLLADVGLVGLPNAGKSTLLRAVSNAVPDVGDFPFTTLEPVLGVVEAGIDGFVMADLPGLIGGAHEGVGLGHQFLRHIERTRVIVHVLDASANEPLKDYETVRREMALHDTRLAEKPEIVALNKIDLPEARQRAEKLRESFRGRDVVLLSGATSEGTRELLQHLLHLLQAKADARANASREHEIPVLHPRGRKGVEIEEVEEGVFAVRGERAEQDALKLGDGGYEALDELQERLKRMGLEKGLRRAGAKAGDLLRVGAVELEWHG